MVRTVRQIIHFARFEYPKAAHPAVQLRREAVEGYGKRIEVEIEPSVPRRSLVPENHDHDDASAGLSWIEVGTDGLLHRKSAALITTKPNHRRGARLQEGNKGDLHRRPVFTDYRTELYNADRTTDG